MSVLSEVLADLCEREAACASRPTASSALDFLTKAADAIKARGVEYDQPGGERSMAATVAAFNAITGLELKTSQGWLFLEVLKLVRGERAKDPTDSCVDNIGYGGLWAEERVREAGE